MAVLPNGRNYSLEMSQIFVDRWYLFLVPAALYLPAMWLGQRWMAHRKPVTGLSWIMFVWNALLSAVSVVMLYRCFETGYTQTLVRSYNFTEAMCMNRHVGIDYGFSWTYNWMMYTKVLELGDTVFLVLRKKPVLTLHWFHHVTVLVFVWGAHVFGKTNVYVVFTLMNTFVHVLMYAYFAFTSIKIFFPLPHILTLLQIAQMVVGCYVVYHG